MNELPSAEKFLTAHFSAAGTELLCAVSGGLDSMKRKGEKLITRAAQGRPAVRWGAVLGLAVAAIALLWDVWFVISPRLKLPLLRSGFRMVVFSVVIMIMVLFFREGIMGDKELWDLGKKKRSAKAKAGVGNE